MKCADIHESLLTDYLDGMLDGQKKKEVEAHLSSCVYCKGFVEIAIKRTLKPFRDAQKLSLSQEKVWKKIRAEIISEEKTAVGIGFLPKWFASFIDVFTMRTTLASTILIIIVAASSLFLNPLQQNKIAQKTATDESVQYLVSAMDELYGTTVEEEEDYGTEIEKYFL
jgi:hypothetical protein